MDLSYFHMQLEPCSPKDPLPQICPAAAAFKVTAAFTDVIYGRNTRLDNQRRKIKNTAAGNHHPSLTSIECVLFKAKFYACDLCSMTWIQCKGRLLKHFSAEERQYGLEERTRDLKSEEAWTGILLMTFINCVPWASHITWVSTIQQRWWYSCLSASSNCSKAQTRSCKHSATLKVPCKRPSFFQDSSMTFCF